MDRLGLYEQWYYKELERKDILENSLNFPFGIVSALLAVWFYYLTNYDFKQGNSNKVLFISMMIITIVLVLFAILFLLNSYQNLSVKYRYGYLPDANAVENYYKELVRWHQDNHSSVQEANKEFDDFLISCYQAAISRNSLSNKRKAGYLHRGKTLLYYSILSLLITSFLYGYHSYFQKDKPEPVYKVEITNPK